MNLEVINFLKEIRCDKKIFFVYFNRKNTLQNNVEVSQQP